MMQQNFDMFYSAELKDVYNVIRKRIHDICVESSKHGQMLCIWFGLKLCTV